MKTLAKEHAFVSLLQSPPGVWQIDTSVPTSGWRSLNPATWVSDTYFDLAGLSMEEKTLFFEGATVQNWLAPALFNITGPGNPIAIFDLMTTSPISDSALVNLITFGNFAQADELTFDQTVYGRARQFVVDVDTQAWGSMVLMVDNQVGSLEPTASDRIYSYRLLSIAPLVSGDKLWIYPARHLLRAEGREEKDYQYLMRLKRSYELQQEPDNDK